MPSNIDTHLLMNRPIFNDEPDSDPEDEFVPLDPGAVGPAIPDDPLSYGLNPDDFVGTVPPLRDGQPPDVGPQGGGGIRGEEDEDDETAPEE